MAGTAWLAVGLYGQQYSVPADTSGLPQPMNWTAEQDHQNMMDQLGIKALRPGPSGNESAPNHANYDESKANPFPNLPDVLTLKNGEKVTTAEMWWKQRRPEIVEDFEREVLGRVPENVPKVTWTVTSTENTMVGSYPAISKQLVGHVDNSSYPLINVDIQMTWSRLPMPRSGASNDDVRRTRVARFRPPGRPLPAAIRPPPNS